MTVHKWSDVKRRQRERRLRSYGVRLSAALKRLEALPQRAAMTRATAGVVWSMARAILRLRSLDKFGHDLLAYERKVDDYERAVRTLDGPSAGSA